MFDELNPLDYSVEICQWLAVEPELMTPQVISRLVAKHNLRLDPQKKEARDRRMQRFLAPLRGSRDQLLLDRCDICLGVRQVDRERRRRLVEAWDNLTGFELAHQLRETELALHLIPPMDAAAAVSRFESLREEQSTLLLIGSTLSNPLTEIALARLFGAEPGQPRLRDDLPIRFCWPDALTPPPSTFTIRVADLPASFHQRNDVAAGRGYAMRVNGDWVYIPQDGQPGTFTEDWGVIVAGLVELPPDEDQRRGTCRRTPVIVVAGASGPGTFEAGRRLVHPEFRHTLPAQGVLVEFARTCVRWLDGEPDDDNRQAVSDWPHPE